MSDDGLPDSPFEPAGDDTGGAGLTDTADGGITEHPVVQGLLSTEPPSEPDTATEYYLSGLKKFLNGAIGVGLGAGRTAAEDFIRGTVALTSGSDDSNDTDEMEPEPTPYESING